MEVMLGGTLDSGVKRHVRPPLPGALRRVELEGDGDALDGAKEVTLTLDGAEHNLRAVNLAIGNCRYAGSGWLAAPRANPEDGLLDLVVIEDVGAWEVLKLAPTVLADSDYLDIEGVFFARAKKIRVETPSRGLEFTVDGEVIGDEPAEFSMIPQALRVVVGPGYVPEP